MTEPKHDPRAKIEAKLQIAVEEQGRLRVQRDHLSAEIAETEAMIAAYEYALEALGPAPRRGRPAAGNGTQPVAPRVRKAKVPKIVERTAGQEERE